MNFQRITSIAHDCVAARLRPGDRAVDATVGNGYDTLFLAHCVGIGGRVDGFDIQEAAISATRLKVAEFEQVRLHCLGHERMAEVVSGPVNAIMFNLGYLPSGDKSIITRQETTRLALRAALGLLSGGGLLTVVVYPRHAGGRAEAAAVEEAFRKLDPSHYNVVRKVTNSAKPENETPYLLAVERKR